MEYTEQEMYLIDVLTLFYLGYTDVAADFEASIAVQRLANRHGMVPIATLCYEINRSV